MIADKTPIENSLVLYKGRPARVKRAGDKLEIEVEGGEVMKVRVKDVALLHPGPVPDLKKLQPLAGSGEVQDAWEILAGGETTVSELAELVYGSYTPATAWAAWQLVADGLYFRGTPEAVVAATVEEAAQRQAGRMAEAAEREAWLNFLGHVRLKRLAPEDHRYLREVEALALKQVVRSRVLQGLDREESPDSAHALLLELEYWGPFVNPYPRRLGLPDSAPNLDVPEALADEPRVDLTHLPAYAIDDASTDTPDDAVSLEGNRVWVHVADAAALIPPDSAIDTEARARGATSYLPERSIPMIPPAVVQRLGLGLAEISPALSFGIDVDVDGQIAGLEIVPSWVRVTRLTYEAAEASLATGPLGRLASLAKVYRARRERQGAITIDLPEVDVRVVDGVVNIYPVLPLRSRDLVQEAMIMAGEATASYALAHDIPMPYATQESVEVGAQPETFSEMVALRRTMRPRQYRTAAAAHAGLGLPAYVQVTSPLRRYLDLVAHQQLRAHLRGERLLDSQAVLERIGEADAMLGSLRQAERLSNIHWTLVYLLQHPKWAGKGVLVARHGMSGTLLIPELDLETGLHLPADMPLDSALTLSVSRVDLARQDARFRID